VKDETYTRETLVRLIERLVEELTSGDRGAWENTTAEAYLDALGGWLSSARGYYQNNFGTDIPDNPWQVMCDAFEAARKYE
jgi:hypothetical protein